MHTHTQSCLRRDITNKTKMILLFKQIPFTRVGNEYYRHTRLYINIGKVLDILHTFGTVECSTTRYKKKSQISL